VRSEPPDQCQPGCAVRSQALSARRTVRSPAARSRICAPSSAPIMH